MIDPAEAALILLLIMLPGHDPEQARLVAREALTRSGCPAPAVEMRKDGRLLEVKAWCRRTEAPKEEVPVP
jgi:hypothetical protein